MANYGIKRTPVSVTCVAGGFATTNDDGPSLSSAFLTTHIAAVFRKAQRVLKNPDLVVDGSSIAYIELTKTPIQTVRRGRFVEAVAHQRTHRHRNRR